MILLSSLGRLSSKSAAIGSKGGMLLPRWFQEMDGSGLSKLHPSSARQAD